ncbi:unnamed protein product [Clavelina lepadiformis]|uniref:AB hydrolase-1 domain-containing protein n=1 Tax=Clavelina lepadiformis TaxID=159417 RepID=A0ABP0FLY9_CLALP
MASYVKRCFIALIYYAIGCFWASIVISSTLIKSLLGGPSGIRKLFRRKAHDLLPEFAQKKFKHDFVRTKSGTRFHYVHTGSEDSPLMLCLHGFPECWYSWRGILETFGSNYHVVAFDMRGYGDSDKPNSIGKYHMHYLVNDVREIVEALGYEKAVIVAHDWGAAIAWELPLYFPEVVDKLIVMNCPNGRVFREFLASHPSQLLKSWYIFFFQLPYFAEWLIGLNDYESFEMLNKNEGGIQNKANRLNPDEIELYKHAVGRSIGTAINYYRAINPIYDGINLRKKTKQIVQPTLFIWGNKDMALDARMVPYCAKDVPGITTHIIDGASHWVAQDEPEKVHKLMKTFLENNS